MQERERLPNDRTGTTQKFTILSKGESGEIVETKGHISTGLYADGRLGEVFLKIGKPGSPEAMYDQWAVAISIAAQYGAPLNELLGKFINTQFEPSGAVKSVDGIMRCKSPLDLVARYLLQKHGTPEDV